MPNTEVTTQKKQNKKSRLGRGLGSLLGENNSSVFSENEIELPQKTIANDQLSEVTESFNNSKNKQKIVAKQKSEPQIPETKRIWTVAIDKISANSKQPRKHFHPEKLKELSESIKEQGILQPIVARKINDNKFEIIAGERRWRAAQQAGLHEVPLILKETDDQNSLELALIENIQRHDLNPIEEAEAYQHLILKYKLTQQQLAQKISKDRATIANMLRLLNLTGQVRKMVVDEKITMGHAKVLVSISDPKLQMTLALQVVNEKLSVRETEKRAKNISEIDNVKNSVEKLDISKELVKGLSEELKKIMGTKVNIGYNDGKGKISIHFYSDQELNSVIDKMRNAWQK